MKRIVSFIIMLAVFYFAFQFAVNLLKTSHEITYVIEKDDQSYEINERYIKNSKEDYYLLSVLYEGKEFVFDIDNLFNKQKKIIKDILIYEENDLICMYPVYLQSKTNEEPMCSVSDKIYTYTSLKSVYNLDEYIKSLPNYQVKTVTNSNITRKYYDLEIYYENFSNNERILIYNYKNLINITAKRNIGMVFANKDVYQNKHGILLDKYYIIPNFNEQGTHASFKVMDVAKDISDDIYFKTPISSNFYINGVVDNILYFFDKSNMTQYSLNPANLEYKVEGTESTSGKAYINGKWEDMSVYDLNKSDVKFTEDYTSITNEYTKAFISGRYFYFHDSNNIFYKTYIENPTKPIELFKTSELSEVKIINGIIYFIEGTTLYRYELGEKIPLLERKEFQYNKTNIYDIYIESK